jgi:hypothetical protein
MNKIQLKVIQALILLAALIWATTRAQAAPQEQDDLAVITSPNNNAVVRGVVPIQGSASYPNFQFYKVEYAHEPIVGEQWSIIGSLREQPVVNGELESWNTSQLPDGSYTIRLRVVRKDGNYSEGYVRQIVVANNQPTPTPTQSGTPTAVNTATALPPTPTIIVEQPVGPTMAPMPTEPITTTENIASSATPQSDNAAAAISDFTSKLNFSFQPLEQACWFGFAASLGLFLLFGFLIALRRFIQGFIEKSEK